jgi:hypothetical protein
MDRVFSNMTSAFHFEFQFSRTWFGISFNLVSSPAGGPVERHIF